MAEALNFDVSNVRFTTGSPQRKLKPLLIKHDLYAADVSA